MDGLDIKSARAAGYNAYDAWKTTPPDDDPAERMTDAERRERWAWFVEESKRLADAWRALPAAERERIERERMEAAPW